MTDRKDPCEVITGYFPVKLGQATDALLQNKYPDELARLEAVRKRHKDRREGAEHSKLKLRDSAVTHLKNSSVEETVDLLDETKELVVKLDQERVKY